MAKTKRSTDTLVAAIREQLMEGASEGQMFFEANWTEADADAGYLLHTDGRMVAIGEYQHGFDHLDELLNPNLSEEVAGYARQEAARIAGSMEAVDMDALARGEDNTGLLERLPIAFQGDADLVERAVAARQVSFEQLFQLLGSAPARMAMEGRTSELHDVTPKEDVQIACLVQAADGTLGWEKRVAVQAGQTVKGYAGDTYAHLNIPGGGVVALDPEQVDFVPVARKPHGP